MSEHERRLMSLTEFKEFMDAHGIVKGKAEWQRRMRAGQFGEKVGRDWIVTREEAEQVLEKLRDSL